jgi:uncharacterized protein (DUF305 family)
MVQIPLRRAHRLKAISLASTTKTLRPQVTERALTAWHANVKASASQSGLLRLTREPRSKPRGTAAFRGYGLVSVCIDSRKADGQSGSDFAAMMIPHHQGAIDMAKVELIYGRDPVLRRLAQGIIVAQQQEIELMERYLHEGSAPQQ